MPVSVQGFRRELAVVAADVDAALKAKTALLSKFGRFAVQSVNYEMVQLEGSVMTFFERIREAIVAPFEDDQSKIVKLPVAKAHLWQHEEAEVENARRDDLIP
jgi:hypothetical protein